MLTRCSACHKSIGPVEFINEACERNYNGHVLETLTLFTMIALSSRRNA
jgi:hypothetical protein